MDVVDVVDFMDVMSFVDFLNWNCMLQKQEAQAVLGDTMTGPQIGYLLPTRDRAARDDHELGPLIRQARLAETLGFDSVWAGDSPITRPRADPLMVLAAAAGVTERVTLGTAVLLAGLRHPILLAHQLATLDRIAEGRLIVGMGAGFPHANTEAQFAAVGVDFERRVSRLTESIEAMRRLWTLETTSFKGRHFDFRDVTLAPGRSAPAARRSGWPDPARRHCGASHAMPTGGCPTRPPGRRTRTNGPWPRSRLAPSRPPCTPRCAWTRTPSGPADGCG